MADTTHTPNPSDTTERVSEKAQEAQSFLREKAGDVAESVKESASQTGQMVQERYSQMRDIATDYLEQGRRGVQQMSRSVEEQIHRQPMTSVLIAAGIGFLAGMLWIRR